MSRIFFVLWATLSVLILGGGRGRSDCDLIRRRSDRHGKVPGW